MATAKTVKKEESQELVQNTELSQVMEMMKKMQEDFDKKIQELAQENSLLKEEKESIEKTVNIQEPSVLETIEPNEYVNVMSLIDHELNVSTQGFGQGENYKFVEYGEVQPIIYTDLSRIISNNKTFLEKNVFVILDERVNKRHQLKKYSEIVTKNMLDSIVSLEPRNVDELFSQLSELQKDNVVDMIVRNAIKDGGESVNYSKLRKMSKFYKRNIQEMLDDSIEFQELGKESEE